MARNKLSKSKVDTITEPGLYGDGDGLYMRVWPAGSKSWIFITRRGGKRREIGLGGYGGTAPVSLALAREKAEEIRGKLARGIDPRDERRVKKTTFRDAMEATIAVKLATFRNDKHKAQWRMTLDRYAAPLHDKPVAEITRDDVMSVLTPIWETIPETADRLRMRIGAVMDHAKARGMFEGDNPAAWKGGLKELLPARQKLSRGHHKAVDYKVMPTVMARLRESSGTAARLVEFITLTAARSGEARLMTWDEIDFEEAVWTVPAERMKAGREHRVPLCDRAVAILRAQQQRATGDLVFEGGRNGAPLSETSLAKALRRASGDMSTTHGLRSSFRDWAGDATSHPHDVVETAMAHIIANKAEAAYRRKDALEKRRALMRDWEIYLNG